jgi:hypothetical protein
MAVSSFFHVFLWLDLFELEEDRMRKIGKISIILAFVVLIAIAITAMGIMNVAANEEAQNGIVEDLGKENEKEADSSSTTITLVRDPQQIDGTAYAYVTIGRKGDGSQESSEGKAAGGNIGIVFLALLIVAILSMCLIHFRLKKKRIKVGRKHGLLLAILMIFMVFAWLPTGVRTEYIGNITIQSDGTIDPPDAPISISPDGITYTLTDDITGTITIQKAGITLDGANYTVQGFGSGN